MNAIFKLNGLVLQTNRLILRPFRQSDIDDFFEYASVEGVGEMAGWKHHESKEITQQILNNFIENDKTLALVLKSNNKVIGSLGIEKYSLEDKLSEFDGYVGRELGFVLSKSYWGQSLMQEAIEAVKSYLFNELNYDFLLCGYYAFNKQSKRVQEKCGFKPYRKLEMETRMKTKELGYLNILINPNKKIEFKFSHPETLIYKNNADDCFILTNNKWFRYRAAAIIIENNNVLFVTNDSVDYYYSVGGAVHIGEKNSDAVIREVFEETGVKYQIDRLAIIHENFFKMDNLKCHEISFYYLMKPRNNMELNSNSYSKGNKEKMRFIHIKDLDKHKVFPSFLSDYLKNQSMNITHIITDDIKGDKNE